MPKIPARVENRIKATVPKFQKILKNGLDKDINEADTVAIIADILEEVFGMDRYTEITREFAIKGTYVDLAVKIEGKVNYLVEVKAVGIKLKNTHLNQAINYAAKEGVKWVVLTNGIDWQIHRITLNEQVENTLISSFNFLDLNSGKTIDLDEIFLLCKQAFSKNVIEDYYKKQQAFNHYIMGALLQTEEIAKNLRTIFRRINPDVSVDLDEVQELVLNSLKREVIESEEAKKAQARVKRLVKRQTTKKDEQKVEKE